MNLIEFSTPAERVSLGYSFSFCLDFVFVLCDLLENSVRCKLHKYCEKRKSNVLDRACVMTI